MSKKNIFLLEPFQEHSSGEVITVCGDVAFSLVEEGKARDANNRDFLVKPEFGSTKALDSPPSKPISRGELRRIRAKRKKVKI